MLKELKLKLTESQFWKTTTTMFVGIVVLYFLVRVSAVAYFLAATGLYLWALRR